MEDKVFLDEAGLGEVGKVISKFYASKDDIKDLDGLKDFVDKNSAIKLNYVTQEEWKQFHEKGNYDYLAYLNEPFSIVALEPSEEDMANGNLCGALDESITGGFSNDIFPKQSGAGDIDHQPFLLINLPIEYPSKENIKMEIENTMLIADIYMLQILLAVETNTIHLRFLQRSDDIIIEGIDWLPIRDTQSALDIFEIKQQVDTMYTTLYSEMPVEVKKWVTQDIMPSLIVNNLTDGGTDKVLSAEQGKVLAKTKVDKKEGYGLSQNDLTNELLDKVNNIPDKHLAIKRFPDGGDLYAVDKEGLYIVNIKTTDTPILSDLTEREQSDWFEKQQYPYDAGYYALLVVFFEGDKKYLLLYNTLTELAWEAHVPMSYVKKENDGSGTAYYWKQHSEASGYAQQIYDLFQRLPTTFGFYSNGYDGEQLEWDNYFVQDAILKYNDNAITLTLTDRWGATSEPCTFLLGATEKSAGVMSADDKKKLNSIDLEKFAQQEKDIKSMKEEIALLKSQIEQLQASINNKE